MSGIDRRHFLEEVIRPVLDHLDMGGKASEQLLLGTALIESNLSYLKQIRGPALGLFQMEPATHNDIWRNYLAHQEGAEEKIMDFLIARQGSLLFQLTGNMFYAVAMCRIHYRRVPEALPDAGDVNGLAWYWKQHYNTPLGAGTIEKAEHVFGEIVELPYW